MGPTEIPMGSNDEPGLLRTLVELSRSYGADPELVLAGGGNTSVKLGDHLLVKASGTALAAIRPEDFVDLDRAALQALLDSDLGPDRDEREARFKQGVLAARRRPEREQRPSVESVLHHLMPGRFVVHLHANFVNQFSCCRDGRRLVDQDLGQDVIWVDLVDPGITLARELRQQLMAFNLRTGQERPRAVIMQNHGLVVSADTPLEVRDQVEWLSVSLGAIGQSARTAAPSRPLPPRHDARAATLATMISSALPELLSTGAGPPKVVIFDGPDAVVDLVAHERGRELALGGPLTPDQIVYCRSFPLWVDARADEPPVEVTRRLAAAVLEYVTAYQAPPSIVLVQSVGLFASGDSWADADTARLVYIDAIKVMAGAAQLGGVQYLPEDFRSFIEHWEVESYRRRVKR